ncbi:hypothetical protein THAOC_33146 [Thalassiosira oceanica]|uniref:Uncharacterized protein n=1 Tax=Thalassiosira oceanica TaxID=159749 RepID=K0R4M4_THAOC|nr:hypothetical protein THAOC_33146 [Thalassiosira oceanica]|eukprot:EJK48088.1 hypothetical protein THAOC_33146 [Thalassiosira oceanica]
MDHGHETRTTNPGNLKRTQLWNCQVVAKGAKGGEKEEKGRRPASRKEHGDLATEISAAHGELFVAIERRQAGPDGPNPPVLRGHEKIPALASPGRDKVALMAIQSQHDLHNQVGTSPDA